MKPKGCGLLDTPLFAGYDDWEGRDIRLSRVFVVVPGGGDAIGIRQPAVQVDVAAALGAKRLRGLGGRLAADRALPGRLLAGGGIFGRLSWHSTSRSEQENLRRRAARSIHTAAGRRYWSRSRSS